MVPWLLGHRPYLCCAATDFCEATSIDFRTPNRINCSARTEMSSQRLKGNTRISMPYCQRKMSGTYMLSNTKIVFQWLLRQQIYLNLFLSHLSPLKEQVYCQFSNNLNSLYDVLLISHNCRKTMTWTIVQVCAFWMRDHGCVDRELANIHA